MGSRGGTTGSTLDEGQGREYFNAAPGTPPATVEAINANRSPLQSRIAGESSLLLTTEGVANADLPTGARGTQFFIAEPGEGPMGRPAVAAETGVEPLPAEPGAVGGPARDPNYRTEHRFADAYLIPELRQQIQASRASAGLPPLDDVQLAVAAGEQARYVMEGVPSTDLAQAPVRPWSGEVIQRPRDPMQMLLAPEVLQPRSSRERSHRHRAPAPTVDGGTSGSHSSESEPDFFRLHCSCAMRPWPRPRHRRRPRPRRRRHDTADALDDAPPTPRRRRRPRTPTPHAVADSPRRRRLAVQGQ